MLRAWRSIPPKIRAIVGLTIKAALTVGAFYLLFTHELSIDGQTTTVIAAIKDNVGTLQIATFLPFVLLAAGIKGIGVLSSIARWHLLLRGQGIRFNFMHVFSTFLIGRFIGTFLPSTIGLDGYKLYDAARFSGSTVRPAAATAVEKVMGLSGIFLTFLVALPFGYAVLGDSATLVTLLTVPVALDIVMGLFLVLLRPAFVQKVIQWFPMPTRARGFVAKVAHSATAYSGKGRLLGSVMFLSFFVHFNTAAMYFFTALAVGAVGAEFWQICFASSIQIFVTVISPLTIAGEGVREIVQALLLAKHIGASESILSAALGFWAGEAVTSIGALFWWMRRADYRPKMAEVDDVGSSDTARSANKNQEAAQRKSNPPTESAPSTVAAAGS